ncbi:MAG: hypothetical protein Q9164_006247 [Protoblastenia rupestris]
MSVNDTLLADLLTSTLPPLTPEFLAESRSSSILAAGIPCTIIAAVAVILRFVARFKIWLFANNITMMADATYFGLGRHIPTVSEGQQVQFLKALLAIQSMYFCTQAIIKTSLLLLYYRIFSQIKAYRWAIYIAGAIVFAWWAALFFAGIFECVPVSAFWDRSIKNPKCFDLIAFSLANGISNLLTDVMILLLPIPMVWRLHMDKKQKLTLTFIFLLGIFVCAISIVRIITLKNYNPIDPTWNCVDIFLWTIVESSIAILSACLPTLRPLFGSLLSRSSADLTSDSKPSQLRVRSSVKLETLTDSTRPVWSSTPEGTKSGFTRLDGEGDMGLGSTGAGSDGVAGHEHGSRGLGNHGHHANGGGNNAGVTSWVTTDKRRRAGEVYPMGTIVQQHHISQREDRESRGREGGGGGGYERG